MIMHISNSTKSRLEKQKQKHHGKEEEEGLYIK